MRGWGLGGNNWHNVENPSKLPYEYIFKNILLII